MYKRAKKRFGTRAGLALVLALGLGAGGSMLASTAASAAEIDAITGVTITKQVLNVNTAFDVSATWAVPNGTQAGDTFTLTFPSEVEAYASVIQLKDPDGNVVGSCNVSANSFVCTLSDYVTTHDNVHGTLWFHAIAEASTTDTELVFTTGNSVEFAVPIPGGIGVTPVNPLPTQVVKDGWMEKDGQNIQWRIRVPGSALVPVNGQDVVFTDTYEAGQTFNESSFQIAWSPTANWPAFTYNLLAQGTTANTYTLTNSPQSNSFSAVIHNPVTDGSRVYELSYTTRVADGTASGHIFGNQVEVNSQVASSFNVRYVSSGGTGTGDALGDFTVTKSVTGNGAAQVAGTSYTVKYSYTDNGAEVDGQLTLASGIRAGVTSLPVGTVVSLSELTPAKVDGVRYGTPVFSGEGVVQTADGATITIRDDVDVAVALENPVSLVPPTPTTTPTPRTPLTPPATTVPPSTPQPVITPTGTTGPAAATSLATTGAEQGPVLAIAVVLLALGAALVSRRRLR